ncbi:MAG: bifunctional diaminohydroxyphosphoribosylaminopyrimidine deaminase/5-amino-6-(5-phosphoribosylamino)uracil reductase RibD [Gammaproteobacteria bacterium]
MFGADDYGHMARALALAERGRCTTDPNPRVGCVLVQGGAVVGEGWHVRAGDHHAEVNALRMAADRARGATAYVTLEPCCHYGRTPPCSDALIAAGVARVVAAIQDPDPRVDGRGLAQLRAAGIIVECGLLEEQARQLNIGYFQRHLHNRPWLRCKLAMSLDGRTAMASGESQWITSPATQIDVQHLRAQSSAILTGIGTVLADDPSLNVRLPGDHPRQPWRVVLDSELRLPANARTLGLAGRVLVFTAVADADRHAPLLARGAEIQVMPRARTGVGLDLPGVARELARREINEVLVESGAILAGALLRAGLIDEMVIYLAPLLLGSSACGLFHLPEIAALADGIALDITDVRAVGVDWRIHARPRVRDR